MTARRNRVLVVDDDRAVRSALRINLQKAGIQVSVVPSAEAALELMEQRTVDLVLTDVRMPGMGGLDLLQEVRRRWPQVEVVVMTGYGNVDDAVNAMKGGAADYIIKPISKNELLVILDRALEARALRNEVVALRREVESHFGLTNIVGSTEPMQRVYELAHSVADTSALVLLQGETGTGKELIARAIHQLSPRKEQPFVRVNCAALPDTLLESELFGHERGSFTGAVRAHIGRFEQADGGSILLDEIGDISPTMQVKLLHVLENHEFQRLGGRETIRADARIVAATNRDLRKRVQEGHFRKDLFYRLNVFAIRLPPLRERRDDIPALTDHFLKRFCKRNNRSISRVSPAVLTRLMSHSWPGNVRELEHAIERAVILATGPEITHVDLDDSPSPARDRAIKLPEGTSLQQALRAYERDLVLTALAETSGVQARAARRLGISRSNLHYRIKKLGVEVKKNR